MTRSPTRFFASTIRLGLPLCAALLAGLFDWAIVWDHMAGTVRGYVLTLDELAAKLAGKRAAAAGA